MVKINSLKKKTYPLYFLVPGIVVFVVFFIVPFFIAVRYSFTNWNFRKADFVGLRNYINVLKDPNLNIAFKNTFVFTIITTVLKLVLGLVLAVFLNRKFKLTNYLRTVFYMPAVISTVAVGIAFTALMHPSKGLINVFLNTIGLGALAQNWLTDPKIAIYSVCMIEVWKWTGYTMMILLAGMQSVSEDYYEAAEIDGATGWQKFRYVTFPLIRPSFNNCLILSIIGGLKVFDIVLATTGGGPGVSTQVLNSVIYRSFSYNMQGEACAGTVFLALFVLLITLCTYNTITKKEAEIC